MFLISAGFISRIRGEKSQEENVWKEEAISENRKKGKMIGQTFRLSHLKPTNEIFI